MAVGDWHQSGTYRFQETEHGPNVGRDCVDCGEITYGTPDAPSPRCGRCLFAFYEIPADRLQFRTRAPRVTGLIGMTRPGRWVKGEFVYLDPIR